MFVSQWEWSRKDGKSVLFVPETVLTTTSYLCAFIYILFPYVYIHWILVAALRYSYYSHFTDKKFGHWHAEQYSQDDKAS